MDGKTESWLLTHSADSEMQDQRLCCRKTDAMPSANNFLLEQPVGAAAAPRRGEE
jgi:hypothetical protein